MSKVIAAIFAAGRGSRMGLEVPKQFSLIAGKPMYLYSAETFSECSEIDELIILVPADYVNSVCKESKYLPKPVYVIAGGEQRNDTLFSLVSFLKSNNADGKNDLILTHDAARPFMTKKIVSDNITALRSCKAAATVFPMTDTVFVGSYQIDALTDRSVLFSAQTPQSFSSSLLCSAVLSTSREELNSYTDVCSLLFAKGERVVFVQGAKDNIKLTYPSDIRYAEFLLKK